MYMYVHNVHIHVHLHAHAVQYIEWYMYMYVLFHYCCPGSEVEEEVMTVMRERIPLAASQPLTHTL